FEDRWRSHRPPPGEDASGQCRREGDCDAEEVTHWSVLCDSPAIPRRGWFLQCVAFPTVPTHRSASRIPRSNRNPQRQGRSFDRWNRSTPSHCGQTRPETAPPDDGGEARWEAVWGWVGWLMVGSQYGAPCRRVRTGGRGFVG